MLSSDLTYERLDDLAVAVDEGTLGPDTELSRPVVATRIGPLLELMLLRAQSRWPRGVVGKIEQGSFQAFMAAQGRKETDLTKAYSNFVYVLKKGEKPEAAVPHFSTILA